jgi:hypothetical protein
MSEIAGLIVAVLRDMLKLIPFIIAGVGLILYDFSWGTGSVKSMFGPYAGYAAIGGLLLLIIGAVAYAPE